MNTHPVDFFPIFKIFEDTSAFRKPFSYIFCMFTSEPDSHIPVPSVASIIRFMSASNSLVNLRNVILIFCRIAHLIFSVLWRIRRLIFNFISAWIFPFLKEVGSNFPATPSVIAPRRVCQPFRDTQYGSCSNAYSFFSPVSYKGLSKRFAAVIRIERISSSTSF